jgi:hypothetical protein
MEDIRETFEIHTNIGPVVCPTCQESLSDVGLSSDRIDRAINHLLGHGWRLLHVGSEWGRDEQGKSISHTVAFLGKV